MTITVSPKSGTASARGDLSYDATRRSLAYVIRVTGVPAGDVFTVSIDVDSVGRKGPMVRHLSGPGVTTAMGTLTLSEVERRELLAGRLSLVVYTREQPSGEMRAPLVLPGRQMDTGTNGQERARN